LRREVLLRKRLRSSCFLEFDIFRDESCVTPKAAPRTNYVWWITVYDVGRWHSPAILGDATSAACEWVKSLSCAIQAKRGHNSRGGGGGGAGDQIERAFSNVRNRIVLDC